MTEQSPSWIFASAAPPPAWFVEAVRACVPELSSVCYAAQLLWNRGIQDAQALATFLNPQGVKPTSPFEFGQEMDWAVQRLRQAREKGEVVAIWGDFDADGITATAVLWDGLRQFFNPLSVPLDGASFVEDQRQITEGKGQLFYYIPNRLTESHGLNNQGIDALARAETQLIVTCDTGSTNLAEVEYAKTLGIDVIITDHHALPVERPPVTAIINPRYLPSDHRLYHLSGVAVAYKLVEALYEALPEVPQQPLVELLDLVAIGLIADLVQLSGECRYLAQMGIGQLQADFKKNPASRRRPGVGKLLELCQKSGDRPTDISFGLGPRVNAVSRIYGDATFCVELLTSQDLQRCNELAEAAELANARRKALQKDVAEDVKAKLAQLDLSTTSVIVLCDRQWSVGVLGLVASQIAQEYGRPTILLSTENSDPFAKGSARSVGQIDLYQLVKSQEHLLHRFGGHPFAAGLSLPVENIQWFTEAVNQQLRNQSEASFDASNLQADLSVTVAELGKDLFRELKLLEPCGMGNPVPKLLIQNCWFTNVWNKKIQDLKGTKIGYIKTEFLLLDDSTEIGFPGIWWGHYQDEIPQQRCDVLVELDYNTYHPRYEVRLLAIRPNKVTSQQISSPAHLQILDWRNSPPESETFNRDALILMQNCPTSWDNLQEELRLAQQQQKPIALDYTLPQLTTANLIWQQLLGIAKYLSRTEKVISYQHLQERLDISQDTLELGFSALADFGFNILEVDRDTRIFQVSYNTSCKLTAQTLEDAESVHRFFAAIREEQFRRQYFFEVPLSTIESMVSEVAFN